jgi:hypothetical protein
MRQSIFETYKNVCDLKYTASSEDAHMWTQDMLRTCDMGPD